jgi:hypothetical protein
MQREVGVGEEISRGFRILDSGKKLSAQPLNPDS